MTDPIRILEQVSRELDTSRVTLRDIDNQLRLVQVAVSDLARRAPRHNGDMKEEFHELFGTMNYVLRAFETTTYSYDCVQRDLEQVVSQIR